MITEQNLDNAIRMAKAGGDLGHLYDQGSWCGTACCVLGFARLDAGLPERDEGLQPGEMVDTPKARTIAKFFNIPSTDILHVMGAVQEDGTIRFPQSVQGSLDLSGLTSAEGLTLPQSVGGDLYLRGLTIAEGLTLPQSVRGYLYLKSGRIR